jgi:hypothetical protein
LDQIENAPADSECRCDKESYGNYDYRDKHRSPPWPSRTPPHIEPVRVVAGIPQGCEPLFQ